MPWPNLPKQNKPRALEDTDTDILDKSIEVIQEAEKLMERAMESRFVPGTTAEAIDMLRKSLENIEKALEPRDLTPINRHPAATIPSTVDTCLRMYSSYPNHLHFSTDSC